MGVGKRFARVAAMSSLLSGCVGDLTTDSLVEIDQAAVLASVARYRDAATYDRISGAYPSALPTTAMVELYATADATTLYEAISPDATGSGVTLPEGSVIVREVLDASGAAQRLTVMAKGPAGYNPALGDWFFAVTDLQAIPLVDNGIPRAGRLEDCFGCHTPRANDDFLFGVSAAMRGGAGGTTTPPPQGGTDPVCGDFDCEDGETEDTCKTDCKMHGRGHK